MVIFILVLVLIIIGLGCECAWSYHRHGKTKEKLVAAELGKRRSDQRLKVAQEKLELAKRQFGVVMNRLRDEQANAGAALAIGQVVETMATQLNELVIYVANPFDAVPPSGRHVLPQDDDQYALTAGTPLQERFVS